LIGWVLLHYSPLATITHDKRIMCTEHFMEFDDLRPERSIA
jgi:hypothetical protein